MTDQHPKMAETVDTFCQRHSIGRTTFYRLVKERRLKIVKLGRRTLVPHTESERLLSQLMASPSNV